MLKLLGAALAAVALGVTSAEVASHKARMDDAQDASLDLKDGLDAKDAAKTADAAGKLVALLDAEEGYWAATGLEDAGRLSKANRDDAAAVAGRAHAGDWTGAQTAYASLQSGCRSCHDQHPERPGLGEAVTGVGPAPPASGRSSCRKGRRAPCGAVPRRP